MAKGQTKKIWGGIFLALFVLFEVALAAMFAVRLDRWTSTERIGREDYRVGVLDEYGKKTEGNTSIYTKDEISVDGMTIDVAKDAEVTYKVFFYDEDGEFLGQTQELDEDVDDIAWILPEGAESARIMITPKEEKRITFIEVGDYVDQVTVRIAR